MDINKIIQDLSTLQGDEHQATLDALSAIIQSRQQIGGGAGMMPPQLEIDPELDMPKSDSATNNPDFDDIEFDDPDKVLDKIKNKGSSDKSNDENEKDTDKNKEAEDNKNKDSKDSKGNKNASAKSSQNSKNSSSNSQQQGSGDSFVDDNLEQNTQQDQQGQKQEQGSQNQQSQEQGQQEQQKQDTKANKSEKDKEENNTAPFELEDNEEESEDNPVIDKDTPAGISKEELTRRKTAIARTVNLGEKAIKAEEEKGKKANKTLIQQIQEQIDKLKKYTNEDLAKMKADDPELVDAINKLLDQVDKVTKVSYSTDIKARIKKINDDANNVLKNRELDLEDNVNLQKDRQAIKAREKEKNKYKSFKTIEDFKLNFYRAIKNQVEIAEEEEETYTALNRRSDEDPTLILPGNRIEDKYSELVPSIDVYFDQSGSWGEQDIEVGIKAVNVVKSFKEKKEIKLNIYYFSNHVHSDAASARSEGGTSAWDEILDNIKKNKTKNVVIMTDRDMQYLATYGSTCIVDGCVWFIWRNGEYSEEIVNHLIGKKGNQQYSFNSYE